MHADSFFKRYFLLVAGIVLLHSFPAFSMTLIVRTDRQMIETADLICDATVVEVEPRLHENGRVFTHIVLDVHEFWKGAVKGNQVELIERGGAADGVLDVVPGTPRYQRGDHVVVFIARTPSGLQTLDAWAGQFRVATTAKGRSVVFRPAAGPGVRLFRVRWEPFKDVLRDYSRFRAAVMNFRTVGGIGRYMISDECLKDDGDLYVAGAKWKPLSDTSNYRWSQFDTGTAEPWYYGNDPQIGFVAGQTSGDGPAEHARALSTWTNDPGSTVSMSEAGQHSPYGPGWNGGTDGISEVLFNDPYDEISGSFSCTSGGVLAFGGVHGVSGSQTFRGESYWTIVEGDVVFQDWTADCSWLDSESLTEVIQHEIGHALALGHSVESGETSNQLTDDALMRWTAHGGALADKLGEDDRCGIYWLYPQARVDIELSANSAVSASPAAIGPGEATTITVNLGDGTAPLPGQLVRAVVTTTSGDASGTLSAGGAYPDATFTDNGDGSYTAVLTAGAGTGELEVAFRVNCCDDGIPAPPYPCDAFAPTLTIPVNDTSDLIFEDGFESGTADAWSVLVN